MVTNETHVSHDHDYCVSKVENEKAVDFVVEKLLNSSQKPSVDTSEVDEIDPLCLSPAYSCDSGIDSFANDLAQGFGDDGDGYLKFLLEDDDFPFDTQPKERMNMEKSSNTVKVPEVPASSTKRVKPVVGKNAAKIDDLTVDERNRKNAENARENRRKKKLYIAGLEKEVADLRSENKVLMGKTHKLGLRVNELESEVDYLRSVIANESMLSKLIEKVSMTPGVSLSTSFCSSRSPLLIDNETSLKDNECSLNANEKGNVVTTRSTRKRGSDSQSVSNAKKSRGTAKGGVCLHVKQSKVSLEFCQHCNKIAET